MPSMRTRPPRSLFLNLALLAAAAALAALLGSCRKPEPAGPAPERAETAFPRSAPIPRQDAFFGLHFDLHPQATDTSLGADISEENIRALLERVKPDFVQYDCKGHAGWAGYPTAVGWASPGIVKDSLAVWRKATRDAGVGLYIHYSGVWDSKADRRTPRLGPRRREREARPQRHERLRPLRRRAPHPPAQGGRRQVRPRRRLGRRRVLGRPARLVAAGPGRLERGDRLQGRPQGPLRPALARVEDVPPPRLRALPRPLDRRRPRREPRPPADLELDVHDLRAQAGRGQARFPVRRLLALALGRPGPGRGPLPRLDRHALGPHGLGLRQGPGPGLVDQAGRAR